MEKVSVGWKLTSSSYIYIYTHTSYLILSWNENSISNFNLQGKNRNEKSSLENSCKWSIYLWFFESVKIADLLSSTKSLTCFSANNSKLSTATDKSRSQPTVPDDKMHGQWSTRHSTGALTANCQHGVSQQHFPSPSVIGLQYAWRNIFSQSTERRWGRDGKKNKERKNTDKHRVSEQIDRQTDRQRITKRMTKIDKELSEERQRAFFLVNWRAH